MNRQITKGNAAIGGRLSGVCRIVRLLGKGVICGLTVRRKQDFAFGRATMQVVMGLRSLGKWEDAIDVRSNLALFI